MLRTDKWGRVALAVVPAAALVLGGWAAWDRWVVEPRLAVEDVKTFGIERSDVPAPSVVALLPDGRPLALDQFRGQVLFVNFWATWCPPCREEMPSMLALNADLADEYPGRFRMIAVSVDEGWPDVHQFFGGVAPASPTVVLDPEQVATRGYYCAARGGCPDSFKFPETYIVDANGRLVAYIVGPRDWSDPAVKRFLERLIRG